ncbi:MAG: bifunctional UDP-N-acetylglucosamine diphosphorylase/glucosamine-1-phosphate N-acetyltransferase GlmU [Burkholderiaceae bacterium]
MNVVILAAGMGKRMHSRLPKVLHPIAGKTMLARVIDTARLLPAARIIVVIGHQADDIRAAFAGSDLHWAVQHPQLGTGHAVQQALPHLDDSDRTLVLYGDVPLTRIETLERLSDLAAEGSDASLAILTVTMDDPTGYGRVVRSANGVRIEAIVEEKDATPAQRAIAEVNTGILVATTTALRRWLGRLTNDNAQHEYYLTDVVALANADGVRVVGAQPSAVWETVGVNNKSQLAELERQFQRNQAEALSIAGVMLADPARIDVRGSLVCGEDVAIDVGAVFEGDVALGDGVTIGPYVVIRNARIAAGARVEAFCHIDGGFDAAGRIEVGAGAVIGPYARLRPGTKLSAEVHIGNFVEVKNSQLGAATKANHLSYLGDATIGAGVNVGAGTITCNYDGVAKHRTTIGDDVQIGSDVQLVAPVTVGAGSTVGAGTTVWKDVAPGSLVVNGKTQVSRGDWRRPARKK